MKFKILNNKLKNNDFIYIIGYFDSFGVKKLIIEVVFRGVGLLELNEVYNF